MDQVVVEIDWRGRAFIYERSSDGSRGLRFVVDHTSHYYTNAGIVAVIWTDYPNGIVHVHADGTQHFPGDDGWYGWVLDIAREAGW